jgi:hypothetical protein
MFPRRAALVPLVAGMLVARPAQAHDVVLGQESVLLSRAASYVTTQGFTRRNGTPSAWTQESTLVLGGVVSPFATVPLSFALAQPFTTGVGEAPKHQGVDSPELAARFQFQIPGIGEIVHADDHSFLFLLGIEPPFGNVDYAPLRGPINTDFGVVVTADWRPISAAFFFHYRYFGADDHGTKRGNVSISGASLAYALVRGPRGAVDLELAVSDETHFHDFGNGNPNPVSGGDQIMLTPAVAWSAGAWRFFVTASGAIAQNLAEPRERDQWRAGVGVAWTFGAAPPLTQ